MASLKVKGMNCGHCKVAVEKAAASVPGVKNPVVDLDKKELHYDESTPVDVEALIVAVEEAGYEPVRP